VKRRSHLSSIEHDKEAEEI
jgi:hypothetical protein